MDKNIIAKAYELISVKKGVPTFGLTDEEGYPFVSAVVTIKNDGMKEFWISTNPDSRKAQIISSGVKAGLCWHDGDNNVTLMGVAEIVTDVQMKKDLLLGWMKNFFPEGPEDEGYCLIKFTTKKARLCVDGPACDFGINELTEALQ